MFVNEFRFKELKTLYELLTERCSTMVWKRTLLKSLLNNVLVEIFFCNVISSEFLFYNFALAMITVSHDVWYDDTVMIAKQQLFKIILFYSQWIVEW